MEGVDGLPKLKDARWLTKCDEFASDFIRATNASAVWMACNQEVQEKRAKFNLPSLVPASGTGENAGHPRNWKGVEINKFHDALAAHAQTF